MQRAQGVKVYIITGGLEVYTKPLLDFLEVDRLIGTRAEYIMEDYKIKRKACKDDEKFRLLKEDLIENDFHFIEAYSDEEE